MLDVGFQELVLILVVALIALGPERLPEIARKLGRAMAELRRTSEDLRKGILQEDAPTQPPRISDPGHRRRSPAPEAPKRSQLKAPAEKTKPDGNASARKVDQAQPENKDES